MIFNMSGGGGSDLNFSVIGSPTQPENPKENTIWVKTETKIPSWVFSPTEPTNPEGGMAFFKTALTSSVGFNALRKNEIAILPTSAQQYIGGQWKNMEAHAYIGGTWVQFSFTVVYLYNHGVLNNAFTGGISVVRKGISENANTRNTPKVTYNTDNIVITNGGSVYNDGGIVHFTNKVNMTPYKTLRFEGSGVGGFNKLYIWPNFGSYINTNSVASIQTTGNLDVSALTGEFYIGFGIYGRDENKVIVRSVYLQ